MDHTNLILQWLTGATAVVGLARLARYRFRALGWTLVYGLLLGIVLVGQWLWPNRAGYVSLYVWLPFVLAPALGQQLLFRLQLKEHWDAATWVAQVLAVLHPMDGWREQPKQFRIIGKLQNGDTAEAKALLPQLEETNPGLARFVYQHVLRVENRWAELRAWIEATVRDVTRSPGAALLYTRALGETGAVAEMVAHHSAAAAAMPLPIRGLSQLFVAAFTGRVSIVTEALAGPHRQLASESRRFWQATSLQAAGRAEEAAPILNELATQSGLIRESAHHRLEQPVAAYQPSQSTEERDRLEEFERRMIGDIRFGSVAGGRRPVFTWLFILVNTITYLYQMHVQSQVGFYESLRSLGALIVPKIGDPIEWWRVWTAGFLHGSLLHLTINIGALWYLGRQLEAVWGRFALAVCYLAATFGANVLTLLVMPQGELEQPMVGASAGVMGVFGALGMFALMSWRELRAEALRRTVLLLGVLLVLQVTFDLSNREFVAWYAHLFGLGFGLLLAPFLRLLGLSVRPTDSSRESGGAT